MYKKDSALSNLDWLICHKTKPNQAKNLILLTYAQLNHLKAEIELFDHLTVRKLFTFGDSYLIYMNKLDLALNNLQSLTCHKTKPNLD